MAVDRHAAARRHVHRARGVRRRRPPRVDALPEHSGPIDRLRVAAIAAAAADPLRFDLPRTPCSAPRAP